MPPQKATEVVRGRFIEFLAVESIVTSMHICLIPTTSVRPDCIVEWYHVEDTAVVEIRNLQNDILRSHCNDKFYPLLLHYPLKTTPTVHTHMFESVSTDQG